MDTVQKMDAILKDEEWRAMYEKYRQLRAEQKKAEKKCMWLIVGILLLIVLLALLGGAKVAGIALLPAIVAIVVVALRSGRGDENVEHAWEQSGARIVRTAVRTYFKGSDLLEQRQEKKNVLAGVIRSDKAFGTQQIKGEWKGKAFCAYRAELLRDGGEDADKTLYEGLILEVEAGPELDASLKAQLDSKDYTAFFTKKGEAREKQLQEVRRVFSRQWMGKLADAAGRVPVMVCVKKGFDRRFVQVGIAGLQCVDAVRSDAPYEEFVASAAAGLERVQRLLDTIIGHEALYERHE